MLLSTPFASPTANTVHQFKAQVNPQVTQVPLVAKRGSSITGWTSLGPITSLWTPPASCYLTTTSYDGSLYIYDHFTGSIISSISCNPPIPWLPIVTSNAVEFYGPATWTSRYYSPAICPSGWSTAADLSPSWQTAAGDKANTAFLCCPTGYAAPTNTLDPCTSYLPSGATLSNVWSRPTISSQIAMGTSVVLPPQVLQTQQRVDAMPIVVLWQSTDSQILDILASISSTASGSQTTSINGASTPHTSLSGGAKGGIAAGIVVVFFAIVLGIFCAFRGRGTKVNRSGDEELHTRARPMTNTHELITPSNKHEMMTKYNTPKILAETKRDTYNSTATNDSDGIWNSIPAFPVPPSSTPPPQQLSTKYNIPKIETGAKYRMEDRHGYASVPLRSPGFGRFEHREMGSGNHEVMSPGEQLTPTIYVPPGSAGFSRESTVLGSSPPGSFGRSSGTLSSLPLSLDTGGLPDPQSRRTSSIPVSERDSGGGGERLENLRDRIERIKEER